MDLKQSPFSLYDFLGYFIPGAATILGAGYVLNALHLSDGPYEFAALASLSDFLPFILAAYIGGHFVSLLSSFTVERYFLWSFDYPSKTLLRYQGRPFFNSSFSWGNVIKLCVYFFLLPIAITVTTICFFSIGKPGMVHRLDTLLSKMIRLKISGLIVDQGQIRNPNIYDGPKESDFFRLVYHYVLENSPSHLQKMQNYVALFGFNRAMALVFVAIFWLCFAIAVFDFDDEALRLSLASAVLANFFFFGFAKFYRRFSLEALMGLAVCYKIPDAMFPIKLPKPESGRRAQVGHPLRKASQFSSLLVDVRRRIRIKKFGFNI